MGSTAVYILACMLWVSGQTLTQLNTPVSEYGMASIDHVKGNFQFKADVIEERINSLELIHLPSEVSAFSYSFDSNQNSLYTKLHLKDEEASLSCEIKRL